MLGGKQAFRKQQLKRVLSVSIAACLKNGWERALPHVAGVVRQRRVVVRIRIEPDLMATCGVTIKHEATRFQLSRDVPGIRIQASRLI